MKKNIFETMIGVALGIHLAGGTKKHPKETAIGVATAIIFVILVVLIYNTAH